MCSPASLTLVSIVTILVSLKYIKIASKFTILVTILHHIGFDRTENIFQKIELAVSKARLNSNLDDNTIQSGKKLGSIGSILLSITTIFTSIVTILSSIEQVNTPLITKT